MFGCYMAWFRHIHGIVALALFLTVEAQDLTLVSRPPDVTYVELGKTLTLNVTYQTNSNVAVTWRKDEENLYTPSFGSTDPRVSIKGQATLVLINTTLSDNGTYKNTVAIAKTSKDINLIVIIQVQPIAVIYCSTNVTVKEGDSVQCLCNSTGGNPPPTASWYKDDKVVSGPENLKTNLSLKNISRNHAGSYSCFVESRNLNDTKSVDIQVQHKPKITSFNSDKKNNISPVGKTVTITCVAEAFPSPNYKIFYNDVKLADVVDGVKTIQSANLGDDGRYECLAKNSVGNISESFNLIVNVRPSAVIKCKRKPLKVKEGDDVECLCNSKSGNPPPTALWYKNHMVVNGTGYLRKVLFLKNISRNDSGTYRCMVKSLDLSNAKQLFIQVQYKPKIYSFESDQENNIVTVGETVKIICKADGFPAPNYTISHDGINLTDNGVKTIMSVNIDDGGQYECVAKNNLGQFSLSFNLTVTVKDLSDKDPILNKGEIGGISAGVVVLIIFLLVLICCCHKHDKCGACCRREEKRDESEAALRGRSSSHGSSANVSHEGNPYESVDKVKVKPNEEAGKVKKNESDPNVSDEGNPYESVDKVKVKPNEEAGTSDPPSIPPLYAVVDKVAQQKEREAKPVPLTYASLDAVLLQPDSSKMRDRSREETKYAAIDMGNLHSNKI